LSRRLALGALTLGTFVAALLLFPPDSDGTLAASDPVYYGIWVETYGAGSIAAHHALFHALVFGLTKPLLLLGVASPGPVALRIVSAASAALAVILVFLGAGRDRWRVGAAFAVLLLATRSWLLEAGVGESIVPGAAAALLAIDQATRRPFSALRVWGSLVLALFMRQDNILIVPGVVLGLWHVCEPGRRVKTLASGLLASAAVTVAGYVAFWWIAREGRQPFLEYMLYLALDPQYGGRDLLGNFPWRLDALGAAVVGRTWPPWSPNVWVGPAFLAAIAVASLLLRGRAPVRPVVSTVVAVVVVRAAFYTWFDFKNWEWSVLTLVLSAYLGARMAEGSAVRSRRARVAGVAVLLAVAFAVLAVHAASTLRLRRPTLMDALRRAAAAAQGARFVAVGHAADLGLYYLTLDHVLVPTLDTEDVLESVRREVRSKPGPAIVVWDRWVLEGDPFRMQRGRLPNFVDRMESTPELRVLRWEGLAYGVRYDPAAESR
jgi:hypothetical protein